MPRLTTRWTDATKGPGAGYPNREDEGVPQPEGVAPANPWAAPVRPVPARPPTPQPPGGYVQGEAGYRTKPNMLPAPAGAPMPQEPARPVAMPAPAHALVAPAPVPAMAAPAAPAPTPSAYVDASGGPLPVRPLAAGVKQLPDSGQGMTVEVGTVTRPVVAPPDLNAQPWEALAAKGATPAPTVSWQKLNAPGFAPVVTPEAVRAATAPAPAAPVERPLAGYSLPQPVASPTRPNYDMMPDAVLQRRGYDKAGNVVDPEAARVLGNRLKAKETVTVQEEGGKVWTGTRQQYQVKKDLEAKAERKRKEEEAKKGKVGALTVKDAEAQESDARANLGRLESQEKQLRQEGRHMEADAMATDIETARGAANEAIGASINARGNEIKRLGGVPVQAPGAQLVAPGVKRKQGDEYVEALQSVKNVWLDKVEKLYGSKYLPTQRWQVVRDPKSGLAIIDEATGVAKMTPIDVDAKYGLDVDHAIKEAAEAFTMDDPAMAKKAAIKNLYRWAVQHEETPNGAAALKQLEALHPREWKVLAGKDVVEQGKEPGRTEPAPAAEPPSGPAPMPAGNPTVENWDVINPDDPRYYPTKPATKGQPITPDKAAAYLLRHKRDRAAAEAAALADGWTIPKE